MDVIIIFNNIFCKIIIIFLQEFQCNVICTYNIKTRCIWEFAKIKIQVIKINNSSLLMDVVIYFIENEILNNFTTILMHYYTSFSVVFSFYIIF